MEPTTETEPDWPSDRDFAEHWVHTGKWTPAQKARYDEIERRKWRQAHPEPPKRAYAPPPPAKKDEPFAYKLLGALIFVILVALYLAISWWGPFSQPTDYFGGS